ncbi:uncharacterized protein LOC101450628, partial [Ceratitis capitata]|uniref:uncharacterized protein LOC101450628 n=1 Tax=Ceratitis capitata TaxID=7213 RepID=UPI000C6C505F
MGLSTVIIRARQSLHEVDPGPTAMQIPLIAAYIKFTNIKCIALDKSFVAFPQCELKALSRNQAALSMITKLSQLPVENIILNLDLYKRANGYRPFMYNLTMDFCQFMRNKKRIPFVKLLMDTLELYSNLNHSCPFDHNIIIKDMVLKAESMKYLPAPNGDYLFISTF